MSKMNQWPRFDAISSSVVRYGATGLLTTLALVAVCGDAVTTAQQSNSNSGKREHVATLRSTDSREGSRVAITSDQSLNNYEAYRRGDRFYVKIPAADVLRPEGVRGRGFADVKAQRSADSTVLSFRLDAGATARVEQHANRLDVVVTVPGSPAAVASNRAQQPKRLTQRDSTRTITQNNRNSAPGNADRTARVDSVLAVQSNLNSANRTGAIVPSTGAGVTPAAVTTSPARSSPTPAPFGSPSPARAAIAGSSPTSSTASTQPRPDFWARLKDRGEHWILLAQLNPIPVALAAALLILIIGLLLIRRRRTRTMRRGPSIASESITRKHEPLSVVPSTPKARAKPRVDVALPETVAPAVVAAKVANEPAAPPPVPAVTPAVSKVTDRRELLNGIAAETTKLLDGAAYNEATIASEDPEMRRLVSAELLSALVGRNASRRERAQQAFMKHGYFDDATRDLRVADSDNERAAAARRLGFVHDYEATPHLIGALGDPAPDVRRASVEALMELCDPAAIGPLNSLMQTENDRKVPRTLIKRAIEACAANAPEPVSNLPADQMFSHSAPQAVETEREVIEI